MEKKNIKVKITEKNIEGFCEPGTTLGSFLEKISPEIIKNEKVIGAKINGILVDLFYELNSDVVMELVTEDSKEGLKIMRHSASHILAQAVQELFPDAKLGIGPATEDGFYYDFFVQKPFTEEDLEKISKRMEEIIKGDYSFNKKYISKKEAIDFFSKKGENLKVEIINEIEDEKVSLYKHDNFEDLCRGPHLPSTGRVGAFKLLSSSGAYWRGDENREMLQRIYGTAFATSKELRKYLNYLEEVKKRDHRVLGKELDLFSIQDEAGAGLVFWHPKGAIVRKIIEDLWKEEHLKRGYKLIYTPHIARIDLWNTSGHLDFYKENMFEPINMGTVTYQLKPMNCPFHILYYRSKVVSYRDLPIKLAELGTVYRFERSGVLHGLLRVRGFTQDDAHIFTTKNALEKEVSEILKLTFSFMKAFGFTDFEVYLSTRPEKFVGSEEDWDRAEGILRNTLETLNISYEIDPGEGVFYGPKIDIKVKDVLGRAWQTTTVQVDFNLPERFDIHYINSQNKAEKPIMIHRALFGSLERFFGILIEHYGGNFPLWLAPEQIRIIPVKESFADYCSRIRKDLVDKGIRAEVDSRGETLSYRIREAELQKVPYIVVIGEKEINSNKVAVRKKGKKGVETLDYNSFAEAILRESKIPEIK